MEGQTLSLEGIRAGYGDFQALFDVGLHVAPGEAVGVVGPNGAGKTTLFNTIAGIYKPDAGTIAFDGERIDGLTPDRLFGRGLARTFQIPRPFAEMTVLENVMLAATNQDGERFWRNWLRHDQIGRAERALRERAMAILEFTTLDRLAGEPARTLSGGQQKLLELARILVGEPKVILLDEPAAGVNPALMDTLVEKIVALNRRGVTFLVIEHNMDLVMSVCSPILVMAQGRLILEGTAEQVSNDPRVIDAYLGGAVA